MASSSQPPKKKGENTTLFSYFSKGRESTNVQEESNIQTPILIQNQEPLCDVEVERDPRKRKKVNDWPLELRDEVRRKYLSLGAYQPKQVYFRPRQYHDKSRKFQVHWYKELNWLEYSPTTHKAYCFPCFLFGENEKSSSALLHDGFDSWKRVHQGKECVFRIHIGTSSSSVHDRCVAYGIALMKPSTHIDQVIQRISSVEISKHRLRLKATITGILRLALQGCAFREHDESQSSLNRRNVIEWIYFLTQWRANVNDVALYNAPKNAKYISSDIQKEILAIIANRVRWQESIDILAALVFGSKAKRLLQELRDGGWEKLIEEVMSFCSKYEVEVPDFSTIIGRGDKQMTLEHMSHVDYFNQSIDFQLGALNSRFNESSVRLLQLSVALDPSNSFRSFNSDHIYKLAEEFYPQYFQYNELIALEGELKYYDTHVVGSDEFQVSSLAKLLEKLVESRMERHYIMICRLIRLVLTLPVSTATTERAFSAMKYVKNDLRNKMADEFFADSLTIFIEREFAINIDPDSLSRSLLD